MYVVAAPSSSPEMEDAPTPTRSHDGYGEEDGSGCLGTTASSDPPGMGPTTTMYHTEASTHNRVALDDSAPQSKSASSPVTACAPYDPESHHAGDAPRHTALYFAEKHVFSERRILRPNTTLPPLQQEKRAFSRVIRLPPSPATGTGRGYRDHVPLTTHVRINDTDGRALSSLLDTGASLSCIDADLLARLGGTPTGEPMTVHGIGEDRTLRYVTLPVFIDAQDPHGKAVHLEFSQDFHVLPVFAPGLCLGRDFIDAYDLSISPIRGRNRIGRYAFQVSEKMPKPFSKAPELFVTAPTTIEAGTQRWVPVDASALAPGIDYSVHPRLAVNPEETVRLAGPAGLLQHGSLRHILVGNFGTEDITLGRGMPIADAEAARVGDVATLAGESFTLSPATTPAPPAPAVTSAPPAPVADPPEPDEVGLPLDVFDDPAVTSPLVGDAAMDLVDGVFRVGLGDDGKPHPSVVQLLHDHQEAFALDSRPGRIEGHDMHAHLQPGATLRSEPPSPQKRDAMNAAIDQLLAWDVIEPSSSPISFPVVMVRQRAKWRFCVGYRHLNAATVPDRYPLPLIDAIFQTLQGKHYFSSPDAIRGYHQLGVAPEDRWKTAFVCERGLFQYKTVPFGLRNAPAVFQRLMDKVFGSLRWRDGVVYIDDIVIATTTLD